MTNSQSPNILLIVADQLTPFLMGAYGHDVVKTPHLNKLAEEGIRFNSAYTSCPLCAPARASLVTGQYASNIRVYDNKSSFSCEEPSVAHYLSVAGYDTVLSGKIHFVGADQLHGFDRRLNNDIFPADFSWQHTNQRQSPKDVHANAYLKAGATSWSKNYAYDEDTHLRAMKYLYSQAETPFFLCVSYQQPHQPFMIPQEFWELYEDETIDLPNLPDNLEASYSQMDRWINDFHAISDVREKLLAPDTLRKMRRAYYGMVSYVDSKVGELLSALDETGQRDNTVILFVSDHGDMLGEHGMIQKRYFYDWSSRIPFIIHFPDGRGRGQMIETPVSIVDVVPTILDIVGINSVVPMDGQSVMKLLLGEDITRVTFTEQHVEGVNAPCFMVRSTQYKYIYIHGYDEQLFELGNDPNEWNNLANDPAYTHICEQLRSLILEQFNPDMIEEDIVYSIKKRHLIKQSMKITGTSWNYRPNI